MTFDPRLPKAWDELRFRIRLRESRLHVRVTHQDIHLSVASGGSVSVSVRGEDVSVVPGEPVRLPLVRGADEEAEDECRTLPMVGGRRGDGSVITASVPRSREG